MRVHGTIKKQGGPPPTTPPPPTINNWNTLQETDQEKINRWRAGDYADAAKQLARIEHRDYAGTVVPFAFNWAQHEAVSQIKRMLELNVRFFYDAAKQGQEVPIQNLVDRYERKQIIYPWEIPLRLTVGKSRRRGMSALFQWLALMRMNFLNNVPVVLIAHNEDSAIEIGNFARNYWKRWPPEMRHLRHEAEINAQGRLRLKNESRFEVFTAGSRDAQENSRGWRFDFYHLSEYAHYSSFAEVTACAAVAPPHAWIIKESTGNGPSGPFYNDWKRAFFIDDAERAYFNKDYDTLGKWDGLPLKHEYKMFFSWLDDPGLQAPVLDWERDQYDDSKLDDYETALKSRFGDKVTASKLKWRRITIRKDCQDAPLPPEAYFAQEWPASPEEMFQATGSKTFAQYEVLAICEALSEREPPIVTAKVDGVQMPQLNPHLGGANLKIYKLPEPGRSYLVGVDPKMGAKENKDEHAIIVMDQHDGTFFDEVASFFDKNLDGKAVGHIATMLAEMYNRAFVTFEIQGGGLAVATTIVADNGYSRVYERKTLDALGNNGHENYFRFGVFTSEQVKDHEVQTVRAIMQDKRVQIRTKKLIDQLRSFERIDGKYGGPENELDDGVMAFLHCIWGGMAQGRPRLHRPEADIEKATEAAAAALAPEMAPIFKAVAAKIAQDLKKNRAKRAGTRASLDKDKQPKRS